MPFGLFAMRTAVTMTLPGRATVGALILSGGRRTQVGLLGLIGFHIGQPAFGRAPWLWAIPMIVAPALLLRAERHPPTAPTPQALCIAAGADLTRLMEWIAVGQERAQRIR